MSATVEYADPPENKLREPCARCKRRTVQPTLWRDAVGPQRDAWKARGFARFSGRGLCVSCYGLAWRSKAGLSLADFSTQSDDPFVSRGTGCCTRCGVGGAPRPPVPLNEARECRDCTEVELELTA